MNGIKDASQAEVRAHTFNIFLKDAGRPGCTSNFIMVAIYITS